MGMAASQARLLSITSRMADNELRSQIINNSKMRLATESSRVSEEYINALNSATMMMSNYDLAGEEQYQKLSFNSLTSYSSYNNQYGLVNANGKLLVSEADAANFRAVKEDGGGLDEFLAKYGLEYTSTFFSSDTLGGDPVPITYIDDDGNEHDLGSYSIQQLKDMYEGTNGYDKSYDDCFQTSEYVNFSEYYNDMLMADANYNAIVSETLSEQLFGNNTGWDANYNKYVNTQITSFADLQNGFTFLKNKIEDLQNSNPPKLSKDNEWAQSLLAILDPAKGGVTFAGNYATSTSKMEVVYNDKDGTYTINDEIVITPTENEDGETDFSFVMLNEPEGATSSWEVTNYNPQTNELSFIYTSSETEQDEETGEEYVEDTKFEYTLKLGEDTATVKRYYENAEELQSLLIGLFSEFANGISSEVNRDGFVDGNAQAIAAKNEYNDALDLMIGLTFGDLSDLPEAERNEKLELIKANRSIFADPALVIKFAQENGLDTTQAFEPVKQIAILDCLFDIYGEPSWGWIDVNNSEENADAKVQWYTNLYNRMEQGYSVIEKGLASSNEWIEFALENGIVTMEQVDSNNEWVSTMYTNISDITEVTDDVAVTRAEAEYNKAMNNIENKDKRYDMELKNIDTEHNSLQTEYDSVKSVIDKNIERSFKIYS